MLGDVTGNVVVETEKSEADYYVDRSWIAAAVLVLMFFTVALFWNFGESDNPLIAIAEPMQDNTQLRIPVAAESQQIEQQHAVVESIGANAGLDEDAPAASLARVLEDPASEINVSSTATDTTSEYGREQGDSAAAQESSIFDESLAIADTADPATDATIASPGISKFENKLLGYPANNFTVQLLGSRSEVNVKEFVADRQVADTHGYFETRHQSQPWYVVVFGNFDDRSTAAQAIQQLPESLRSLQPWVRPMNGIQADIRQLHSL